jgi:hypothetical protein
MIICVTHRTEDYIGKLYTNYNLAYNGEHFSNSFMEFNSFFIHDLSNAILSFSTRYKGRTCMLGVNYVNLPPIGIIAIISQCKFDPIALTRLKFQTHIERIKSGNDSVPPSLIASSKRVSDYKYYSSGGTYYDHVVDIVKKKNSSKTKPQFNYYDRNTKHIMFDFDFYSPFTFENNETEAWATDGHKYKLPYMILIETNYHSKEHNDTKPHKIRLSEGDLHRVIKRCVNQVLRYYI